MLEIRATEIWFSILRPNAEFETIRLWYLGEGEYFDELKYFV